MFSMKEGVECRAMSVRGLVLPGDLVRLLTAHCGSAGLSRQHPVNLLTM